MAPDYPDYKTDNAAYQRVKRRERKEKANKRTIEKRRAAGRKAAHTRRNNQRIDETLKLLSQVVGVQGQSESSRLVGAQTLQVVVGILDGDNMLGETGAGETGADETPAEESGADEAREDETGADEAREDETGADEARDAEEHNETDTEERDGLFVGDFQPHPTKKLQPLKRFQQFAFGISRGPSAQDFVIHQDGEPSSCRNPAPCSLPTNPSLSKRKSPPGKIDESVPKNKKARLAVSSTTATATGTDSLIDTRPCISILCHNHYRQQLWQFDGRSISQFNLSNLKFHPDYHADDRLDLRGGMDRAGAVARIELGKLHWEHGKQQLWFVYFDEQSGVKHFWPVRVCPDGVYLWTYFAHSPLRTGSHQSRARRQDILDRLYWLSKVLEKPFDEIIQYVVEAIETIDILMLYRPGYPAALDVVATILPTDDELRCLQGVPYVKTMGEPEEWIVAIGEIHHEGTGLRGVEAARALVTVLRYQAWSRESLVMDDPLIFLRRSCFV